MRQGKVEMNLCICLSSFFQQHSTVVHQQLTPKLIKQLAYYKISKVCPGSDHTVVIDGILDFIIILFGLCSIVCLHLV